MKALILSALFSLSTSVMARPPISCPDKVLIAKGWDVKIDYQVKVTSDKYKKKVHENPADYSTPVSYKMYSSVASRWVVLTTTDAYSSPEAEMLGDILWIKDLLTKEVLEVRWYDGQKIHARYSLSYQDCATNLIPFVDNSLY